MATNPILGRDVYLALAAVGWADGRLTKEGADAILRTALEEGVDLDAISEIEQATKIPQEIGIIERVKLSKSDRLYVYAVASWITELDGKVTDAEQAALAKLAAALGVPEAPRAHADAIMREIAAQGDRPDRFDLRGLRRRLDEELERARAARLASFGGPIGEA
jgi:tellurite resistance protein